MKKSGGSQQGDPANEPGAARPWLARLRLWIILELLFVAAAAPYLSGNYAYAPQAVLYDGVFAAASVVAELRSFRDEQGQRDFMDQERQFLRFYRDSVRRGELPFWNERPFGGLSQEDSLVYSYLSPLHLPWLLIENDHLAKGVQILLLLNLGAFAIAAWSRILGLGERWTLLLAVLATLTPLALHFQAHTHQPGTYYAGLLVLAAYDRFLESGGARRLALLFAALLLLIALNFISVFGFVVIALVCFALPRLWCAGRAWPALALERLLPAVLAVAAAVCAMSFFLGPILLEAHLVREAVVARQMAIAPWSGTGQFIASLAVFRLGFGHWTPFHWLLLFIAAVAWQQGWLHRAPPAAIGGVLFLLLTAVLGGATSMQAWLQANVPGFGQSANIFLRMSYFAGLCALPALGWLAASTQAQSSRTAARLALALLAVVALVNATLAGGGLAARAGLLVTSLPRQLERMLPIEMIVPAVLGAVLAIAAMLLFGARAERTGTRALAPAAAVGVCLVAIYQFSYPNLPARLDPVRHPLFDGLERGRAALTLERCSSKHRSWYRSEAALGGLRTLDGPTDTGLFRQMRRFWAPLNDIEEINATGANLLEVMWVCIERIVADDRSVRASAVALLRALGVKYLFVDGELRSADLRLMRRIGALAVYEIADPWPDVSFLPGVDGEGWSIILRGLVNDDRQALARFATIDSAREAPSAARESNLRWRIAMASEATGRAGTLFMNHPLEYHRGWRVPGLDWSLEGRWQYHAGGEARDFPLSDVPYRILEIRAAPAAVVAYNLEHYRAWGVVSLLGLFGFVALARGQRRRERASAA